MVEGLHRDNLRALIQFALAEDIPNGDITTEVVGCGDRPGKGIVVAKERMVWCEAELALRIAEGLEATIEVEHPVSDGDWVEAGEVVLTFTGSLGTLLKIERTLLNFVQRLSGIATHTRKLVEDFPDLTLLDTRKTLPGYRALEKYAVRVGGGKNHRFSLSDQILIKDNHIAGSESCPAELVKRAKERRPQGIQVEIEVTTLDELRAVLDEKPDIVMLDNFTDEKIREGLAIVAEHENQVLVEVSGNITRERLSGLSDLTQCAFSMGSLTYGAGHVDLSMSITHDN